MRLDKNLLKRVLKEFHESSLPEVFPRDLDLPVRPEKIIALTGPRRSGKTCLLFGLIRTLLAQGVSTEQLVYLNLEDPRLHPFEAVDFEMFYEAYRELYPKTVLSPEFKGYLFLDEIQTARSWELGVRRLFETRKFHLYITDSSSRLMSYDIASELRGRALTYELFPFSFNI